MNRSQLIRMSFCSAVATLFGCRKSGPPAEKATAAKPVPATGFQCRTCGQWHQELPALGVDYPLAYEQVPAAEQAQRTQLTADTCVVDSGHYVRGILEIPVHLYPPGFAFGVWVSHKKENFEAYVSQPDSDAIGPFFGWLSTALSHCTEDTINLPTMAYYRKGGLRPRIVLDPESMHELAFDQRNGISLQRALEIVHHYTDGSQAK
jgi:hypothetical protein